MCSCDFYQNVGSILLTTQNSDLLMIKTSKTKTTFDGNFNLYWENDNKTQSRSELDFLVFCNKLPKLNHRGGRSQNARMNHFGRRWQTTFSAIKVCDSYKRRILLFNLRRLVAFLMCVCFVVFFFVHVCSWFIS